MTRDNNKDENFDFKGMFGWVDGEYEGGRVLEGWRV